MVVQFYPSIYQLRQIRSQMKVTKAQKLLYKKNKLMWYQWKFSAATSEFLKCYHQESRNGYNYIKELQNKLRDGELL